MEKRLIDQRYKKSRRSNALTMMALALVFSFQLSIVDCHAQDLRYRVLSDSTVELCGVASGVKQLEVPARVELNGVSYAVSAIGEDVLRATTAGLSIDTTSQYFTTEDGVVYDKKKQR